MPQLSNLRSNEEVLALERVSFCSLLQKNVADNYIVCRMLFSKGGIISLLIFILLLPVSTFIFAPYSPQDYYIRIASAVEKKEGRLLQASSLNPAAAHISKILSDSNTARKAKGKSSLNVNPGLLQISKQWATSMKGRMPLLQYVQLFGIHTTQAYTFAWVPIDYLVPVIEKGSPGLTNATFTDVGIFSRLIDGQNYEIIIVLQGGDDCYQDDFTKEQVLSIIKEIEIQKSKKSINQTISTIQNKASPLPIITPNISTDKKASEQANQIINTTNSEPGPPLKEPVKFSNVTAGGVTPLIEAPKVNQSSPNNDQARTTSQIPSNTTLPPVASINASQQNAQPKENAPLPSKIVASPPPLPTPQPSLPVVAQNITIFQSPPVPQPVPVVIAVVNNSQPLKKIPNNQPKNIPYQPINSNINTSTFKNIVLTHAIPSTFVKNQIFPFKGYITVPNPSGIKVNVIFTRVSDQKRLTFNSYIPAGETDFQVLAVLTLSGNYYLSIFTGLQGYTSMTQYTIIPSFFGKIVAKSPAPLTDVTLTQDGNDLWLNWNSSEASPPALTQIIFSQQSGQSIQFLLSNSESSFKVPYAQFTSFSLGPTTISVSQAFSWTQSAGGRSSDFSAPYSIIFNAVPHNFAKFTGQNRFQPIPFRVNVGDSIKIATITPVGGLDNEVILLSPTHQFISYYFTSTNKKTVEGGVSVGLSIPFNQSGVYILEVNSAAGEALINIPIYVGDIYPLLPDFMDLAPANPDSAALSDPYDLDSRRAIIEVLINDVRSQFGAPRVYADQSLNNLAQNYSSTLIQQQFLSHIDKQGKTPSMRAKAAGIFQGVCENLAVNSNLTQAQLMLQRSPAHLRAMINPAWTRVGLGIVQDRNQVYYLTQQFSSRDMKLNPLTTSQLALIQKSILDYIQTQFPSLKTEDKRLSSDLSKFQQQSQQSDAMAYLKGEGYHGFSQDSVEISYNAGNYMALLKQSYFEPSRQNRNVGVSVIYNEGKLKIEAAYY